MTLGGSFLLKLAPSPALEFQTQLFILVSPIFLILNSLVLTDALFGALALAHTPRPLRLLIVRLIGSTLKKQTAPLPGMAPGGGFEGRARGGGGFARWLCTEVRVPRGTRYSVLSIAPL